MSEISEAASKNRRGRPTLFPYLRGAPASLYTARTNRGRQDTHYALDAMKALGIMPNTKPPEGYEELWWLADWEAADQHKKSGVKWGISTELGRLLSDGYSDETVSALALRICRERPSVKEGAAWVRVRRLRLQGGEKFKPADGEALRSRLAACLDQYRVEHPDISESDVLASIDDLYRVMQEVFRRERDNG